MKVLVSADGANFQETHRGWRSSPRAAAASEEFVMFDAPLDVKALTVVMRSPQRWKYVGLNSVVLLSDPGPFMLIRCPCDISFDMSHDFC